MKGHLFIGELRHWISHLRLLIKLKGHLFIGELRLIRDSCWPFSRSKRKTVWLECKIQLSFNCESRDFLLNWICADLYKEDFCFISLSWYSNSSLISSLYLQFVWKQPVRFRIHAGLGRICSHNFQNQKVFIRHRVHICLQGRAVINVNLLFVLLLAYS